MPADFPETLPQIVANAARVFAKAPAIVAANERISYADLGRAVDRAAAAFISSGINKGDRVAIWAPNSPEWIIAALATLTVGGVIVPLNTRLKGKEAAYILRRSGARVLLTVQDFLGVNYCQLIANESLPTLERTLLLSGKTPTHDTWQEFLARCAPVTDQELRAAREAVNEEDVADIMFTSGTTGQPKGVMSTHAQNVRVYSTWCDVVGLQQGDRYLIVNPFFHSFGYKAGWLACILRGATIFPVPIFNVEQCLELVERERISVLPGPPTIFQSLLASEHRARFDLSSLTLAVTGAATVPPSLIHRMRTDLGFKHVVTAYGLTESTGTVTISPRGSSDELVATRCGLPIPGVEVRCVGADGIDVPVGEPGEVYVRGYNVMRGYFEDPAATAETIDAHGWLHTGDVGVLDAAGYLRITDRMKDMFIVGGFNCYPAEIEKILCEHPDVSQAAVIGVPDERLGEVGKAYVVLRAGGRIEPDELIAWCRTNMANYKVPRMLEVVDALPVNASGKVQKFALRERDLR